MKKFLCAVMLVLMLFSGYCEETPDGSVEKVYFPFFEKDALQGFQYVLYPEKSGLLLSAYSDDAEIAVTAEEDDAENAEEFLKSYIGGMERYAAILNTPEVHAWEKDGVKTRILYRHNKASEDEDAYTTDAYVSKISENMYLLIVFNAWNGDLTEAEQRFFDSFRLEEREVSKVYMAFLKNARADEEGNQYASVDFCQVVYDEEIFAVYAQNDVVEKKEYRLSEDALIWSYDADASLYAQCMIEPTAENLVQISAHYYENMGFDVIFQILFDANNEIVWMMHYNAF